MAKSDAGKQLEKSQYISFSTYKKNGDTVETPVWFAGKDGTFFVFSNKDAGKAKRLRNFSKARIAACDVRGKLRGDWHEAQATFIDSDKDTSHAEQLLLKKYGWQFRLLGFLSGLSGKRRDWAHIKIQVQK